MDEAQKPIRADERPEDEVLRRLDSVRRRLAELDDTMQLTAGYWEGESGETCRAAFREIQEELEERLSRVQECAALAQQQKE